MSDPAAEKVRPMLAAIVKQDQLDRLSYPMIVQPKYDGIRCLITSEGAMSRTGKEIPNRFIYSLLSVGGSSPRLLGLDGELIVGPTYADTASAVMSADGAPTFKYYVFDKWDSDSEMYLMRYADAIAILKDFYPVVPASCQVANNPDEVLGIFGDMRHLLGYQCDGIILRSLHGKYKHGRSTLREQYLVKYKEFDDADANVVGYVELLANENPLQRSELGYAKRSHAMAGKIGGGVLGSLVCTLPGGTDTFSIGTGFTEQQRRDYWAVRDSLVGRVVKFRSQGGGGYELPRFPSFLGFRD